ncbi:MAG: hypothetical protein OEX07_01475 [Gammaproteobacteria bacterium]|nr:hypothetical protein [Gammaproteobacteria bacterium]
MELVSSGWHIVVISVVFLSGLLIVNALRVPFNIKQNRALLIYLWHTLFCIAYMFYSIKYGADSVSYYEDSFQNYSELAVGTGGIVFLTSLFTRFLDFSYFGVFLVFNIFGAIGLLAFDASLKVATLKKPRYVKYIASIFVFLPSTSFWSSAIGKDSLSFMAVGLALWAVLSLKRRVTVMGLAVLVMLFVRPHMAGIMILALSGAMLLQNKIPLSQRVLLGGVVGGITVVLVPFAINFSGLEFFDTVGITNYIQDRQSYNQIGGGGIDISAMSFPVQLFTYLFRPLPFEAHSMVSLASSVENTILLFVCFVAIKEFKRYQYSKENRVYMWLYVLISWAVLATTTANLGISARQKWMFLPVLIFLLISRMGGYQQINRVSKTEAGMMDRRR